MSGEIATQDVADSSTIRLHPDLSSPIVVQFTQRQVFATFAASTGLTAACPNPSCVLHPLSGSLFLVGALTFVNSLCGMCPLISAVSNSESPAIMLPLGAFYPTLLLSGIIWPLEAMQPALRWFALALPETVPIRAMQLLMVRGWNLSGR